MTWIFTQSIKKRNWQFAPALQDIIKHIIVIQYDYCRPFSKVGDVVVEEYMNTYAGELKDCGYKFHRWYTLIYMDKQIGPIQEEMSPIRDFAEVRKTFGL